MTEGIRPKGDFVVRGGLEDFQFLFFEKELHRHRVIFQFEEIPQTENDVGMAQFPIGILRVGQQSLGKLDVIHKDFCINHGLWSFCDESMKQNSNVFCCGHRDRVNMGERHMTGPEFRP